MFVRYPRLDTLVDMATVLFTDTSRVLKRWPNIPECP